MKLVPQGEIARVKAEAATKSGAYAEAVMATFDWLEGNTMYDPFMARTMAARRARGEQPVQALPHTKTAGQTEVEPAEEAEEGDE